MTKMDYQECRYFIVKSYNMQGISKSRMSSEWACSERKSGPQIWEIIAEAFNQGTVKLIFSVNNCHGYHGYATVTGPPADKSQNLVDAAATDTTQLTSVEKELQKSLWRKFPIRWEKVFLDQHGEQCLPFQMTEHLRCLDNTPLNSARNFQEIHHTTGDELCQLLDEEYQRLSKVKQTKMEILEAKQPDPFLKINESSDGNITKLDCDWKHVWDTILKQVQDMGTVLLACAFGSQRYNCDTPNSDMDMFIVYQAPTKSLLGFSPPSHTIKNKEKEKFDYTILELQRFCELVLAGDPRCVECLFLHPSSVYRDSVQYKEMCSWKQNLITKQCVEKYLNDACGAKGLRLLEKWVKSGEALQEPLPRKVGKLFYIIIRLLQNARDIVKHNTLKVYRETESEDRKILMKARACEATYSQLREVVDRLEKEVRDLKEKFQEENVPEERTINSKVEQWLLRLRYLDMHSEFGQ